MCVCVCASVWGGVGVCTYTEIPLSKEEIKQKHIETEKRKRDNHHPPPPPLTSLPLFIDQNANIKQYSKLSYPQTIKLHVLIAAVSTIK